MSHDHHQHHQPVTKEEFEHTLVEHDSWFRHDASEPHHQAAHGSTKPLIIVVFLAATVVFVGTVAQLCIQLIKHQARRDRHAQQESNVRYVLEVKEAKAGWETQLTSYEWIDAQTGQVRIPIAMADKLVIAEYAAKQGKKN